ncbi:MAG: DUF2442 domain-containing protein [Treponema sp.]|nr:DUF2442 domain-containing protein [Treponema sp.]
MVWVTKAEIRDSYNVYVEFNDGLNGIINLFNVINNDHRLIVKELINIDIFKTLNTELDTLCWDNGVDFAPEYLYEQLKNQQKAAA